MRRLRDRGSKIVIPEGGELGRVAAKRFPCKNRAFSAAEKIFGRGCNKRQDSPLTVLWGA